MSELFRQFMELVEYRINDAWEHQWSSYPNGQVLGYINDFANAQMMFNRESQDVIELTVFSENGGSHYRWINPLYQEEIQDEATKRNVDHSQACENEKWIDLETTDDFFEKASAMLINAEFDPRIQIPLELEDAELLVAMKAAHELDITFNQYMERALLKVISDTQPKNTAE